MKSFCKLALSLALGAFAFPVNAAPMFFGSVDTVPVPPAAIGGAPAGRAPVILAQSSDPVFRIGKLEEEVRTLNGKVEELGFQLLQMQEKMRQMQQDNEFRFQELEKKGSGSKRGSADPAVTAPGIQPSSTASATPNAPTVVKPQLDMGALNQKSKDDLIGGIIEPMTNGTKTASLSTPEDIYQSGYNHMLAGDYVLAEQVFRDFMAKYPQNARASDAMFWLGEAEYSQGKFKESAKTFLDAHKRYPQADKGADTLLKLGMSLAKLNSRETACATLREVLIRYPGASAAVRAKVGEEQKRASC